jgi:hypothetical protein
MTLNLMTMKKLIILLLLTTTAGLTNPAQAQEDEIQQLALNIQKLAQFKQILKDLKKGYEIVHKGYSTVKNLSEGNFKLHQTFLDGLWQISPTVRNYRRVKDIIQFQVILVREYKQAYGRFRQEGRFTPQELHYLGGVYENLFRQSLRDLDELATVITAKKLRMSDDERLTAIDRIYSGMQDKLLFLRDFNNRATLLAAARAKEQNDAKALRSIYGTN